MAKLAHVPSRKLREELAKREEEGEFILADEEGLTVSFRKGGYSIELIITMHFWFFTLSRSLTLWTGDTEVLIEFLKKASS